MKTRITATEKYLYIGCLLLCGIIIFGAVISTTTAQILKQQLGNKALGIASAVAAILEEQPKEYREFIETLDTRSEFYIRSKALIEKIRASNEGNIAFITVEVRVSENEVMYPLIGEKEGTETYSPPGTVESFTVTRRRAYDTRKAVTGDFVTTKWGTLLSAYVPVFDKRNGEFIGLVGTDISIEQYHAVLWRMLAIILASAVSIAALIYFLVRLAKAKIRADAENISKTSFLAQMNHEMRTAINTILGMAEVLMRKKNAPQDVLDDLSVIYQAGKALSTLVGDILDFSRTAQLGQPDKLSSSAAHPADAKEEIPFSAPEARVLVVDDISVNLRVAQELLKLYGISNVQTCLSGPEAIAFARSEKYDLVFMDHMMPDMDGMETTALIRALETGDGYYKSLPIVALTANAVAGNREKFLRGGMNDFLSKPIDMQRLTAVLRQWLPEEKQIEKSAGAKDLAAAENTPPDIEIPGVNVENGLRNTGGSFPVYLDMLETFCADAEDRAGKIEACARDGNIALYGTLAHALKSASRIIGADDFADFAAQMEKAAANGDSTGERTGDSTAIIEKTPDFLRRLTTLTGALRSALARHSADRYPEKGETLAPKPWQWEVLRNAISDRDIQTVNKFLTEYAARPLPPDVKRTLSEVEDDILQFEYDAAIKKVETRLNQDKTSTKQTAP
ncbi:MAG: response regulator [Candidatus Accumulibacter sp.]|nr:response regulator [Accumulibacter sp.]